MYVNVSFVDLSRAIYVQHFLWEKSITLETVLDFTTGEWERDKITVNGMPVKEQDLKKKLSEFNTTETILGEYELQIERRR